ncbi:MAG: hypothetical protein ACR2RL_21500 [Gammaproteobacteria bacterium]
MSPRKPAITEFHWDLLRTSVLRERAAMNRQAATGESQRERYAAMADALGTMLNEMRRIERQTPPTIEDIKTDG